MVVDGDLATEDVAVNGEELGLVGGVDVGEESCRGALFEFRAELGQANHQRADFPGVDAIHLGQWPRQVPPQATRRNLDTAASVADQLSKTTDHRLFVAADVSRAGDVEGMVDAAVAAWGRLDFAFNNAGIQGDLSQTAECTEENWDQITGINLKGVWLCMKYEIPHMLTQGQGSIVNISSIGGLAGFVWNAIYSATKHGVIGLTESAAIQYAKDNIRINAVCPGVIDAGITGGSPDKFKTWAKERKPMGRFGSAEEVAEACVWLCSEKASFITGHSLPVDGGWMSE